MKHINVALFVPHAGCPHQCSFCNQKLISGKASRLTQKDVIFAAETAINSFNGKNTNSEIAFFGGSFTAIEKKYMQELLDAAKPYIENGNFKGIRISTRPDAIDEDVLDCLKAKGVTAIELGAQSMLDRVLLLNNRGHKAQQTRIASRLIKKSGFELGLQMMTGLLGDNDEGVKQTAKAFIDLGADTVRIYPTVVLKNTLLETLFERGEYIPQSLEDAVNICAELLLMFHKAKVPVIRLGLHSGGNVEQGFLAGAYHPAFRELCENKIYLELAKSKLSKYNVQKCTIKVNTRDVSKMIGHNKSNIIELEKNNIKCKIVGSSQLDKYEIQIDEN